ncbi:MAG: hypothetical protein PF542_02210 [Nanoarchaeota archaeon]|jgi:hypothetical protein|nr:hypothetical protein [Nanoarchaeota archaeon]
MEFKDLEKKLRHEGRRLFIFSGIVLMLIILFVVFSFVLAVGLFLLKIVLGFGLFALFGYLLWKLFVNHRTLIDVWDERIYVRKKLRG